MGEFGDREEIRRKSPVDIIKDEVIRLRKRFYGIDTLKIAGDRFEIERIPLKKAKGYYRYYIKQITGGREHPRVKVIERNNQEAIRLVWYWNRVVGPPNIENVTLRVSRVKIPDKVFVMGDWVLPDGGGRRISIKGYAFEYTAPREGRIKDIADIGGVLVTECEEAPEIIGKVLRTYREHKKGVSENNLCHIPHLDSEFRFPGLADYLQKEYLDPLAKYYGKPVISIT